MLKYEEIKHLHIELSSNCNSACPTCPRNIDGGITHPYLNPGSITLTDFKTICQKNFLKQILSINFCGNYGDPFMCRDVLEILDYIYECNNIEVVFHTNGGIRNETFWKRLGKISSMQSLRVIFSIDGLEDTNHLYRIGVDWNRLMKNCKTFISNGGDAWWDMLVFKHNEHQIKSAKQLAKKLGFNRFIEGQPHGFKYNDKIRVVDKNGKFQRFINRATEHNVFENQSINFKNINFDLDRKTIIDAHSDLKLTIENLAHPNYQWLRDKLAKNDNEIIKTCMARDNKEIYIDSTGGVHPCCYLGHINQDAISIPELMIHKLWIIEKIGMDKINAILTPLKKIIDSEYFKLIEESWSKTFDSGRNPMCALKCGVQVPNAKIRSNKSDKYHRLMK